MILRRVEGESMLPALQPGDLVLASRRKEPETGDIVIARVVGREIIKRVKSVSAYGIQLQGDNHNASTDSRKYGLIKKGDILGVVTITGNTMRFAHATAPPAVKDKRFLIVPYTVAVFIFFILLVTLIAFDKFILTLSNYFQNDLSAKLFACLVVLVLLFALPYLLRLRLSPLARLISILCSLTAPVLLLMLILFSLENGLQSSSPDFAAISLYSKVWAYFEALTLFVLSVWSFYILGGEKTFQVFSNLKK